LLLLAGLLAACASAPKPVPSFNPDYADWNAVLTKYVTAEGVDYAALAAGRDPLTRALAIAREVTPAQFAGWTRPARLAFLINVHNMAAMDRVARRWPVDSIQATRGLGSALAARDIALLGEKRSLASLRAEIMGAEYLEARAIFLLNWAQAGCVTLPPVALNEHNLTDLLERQARLFFGDARWCRYDLRRSRIELSPLVRDYREDFERDFTTLWVLLDRYLPEPLAKGASRRPPRIQWLEFDTTLNAPSGGTVEP
jgi:hypothetical protein